MKTSRLDYDRNRRDTLKGLERLRILSAARQIMAENRKHGHRYTRSQMKALRPV